ncbi:Dabb family protein [Bacteroides mediterraneensis]|uniref:Dabb family protein n=1 Tax=Bacteroides mediterraneensis TaxID=1841856 RepID=UPI001958709E|nr:Dabb family protein [Bacteroides mediterraneensis]MBM6782249.1 Dabb family protein [Bacteroides mediterraneensis]
MVKHIVLFKLKESLAPAEKTDIMYRFKDAIEALPATISFIRDIHVGLNENPAETWDICLDSSFDTLDDVKAYSIHPAHVAAAGILKEAKENRACVDYTL